MKYKFIPFKSLILLALTVIMTSCHEDNNLVGNEVIGDPNFEFKLFDESTIIAYSRKANPVQTTSLNAYQMGVYIDPVYGTTTANVLSQVTLSKTQPTFGIDPKIESVYLDLPYFSTVIEDLGDLRIYQLDSMFGSTPFKLSIYESNYYLRDLDPDTGFSEEQKYYSDQGPLFEGFLGGLLHESVAFMPTSEELTVESPTGEELKLSPRMRVVLDTTFFKQKIIDFEGKPELFNNNNFKNHLRGLHFKVEQIDNGGILFLFDINRATIDINYTHQDTDGERIKGQLKLNFSGGVSVNTFDYQFPPTIEDRLSNPNTTLGEENLYLKGGAGTMTIIDLFGGDYDGNGIPDELETLREKNWIINEANLLFHVNQDIVQGGKSEPERVFLYDLNNETLLRDYALDNYTSESDVLNYKSQHLGRLKRDSNGDGSTYKLKITNYVNDLIKKDSLNHRLGLVVSQNVGIISQHSIQTEIAPGFDKTLTGSVICPEGTVLYGNNTSNEDKKLILQIYYTELIH